MTIFLEHLIIFAGKFPDICGKMLTIFVRNFDNFCKKIWRFSQNDFCRKIWWSFRKIWRFSQVNLPIFGRKFNNLCKMVRKFLQENLTIFSGKYNDFCWEIIKNLKNYTSRHRGSYLGPQEQTPDKKLLQNVNSRM